MSNYEFSGPNSLRNLKLGLLNVTVNQSRQNYNIICQIHMEILFD